MRAKSKTNQDNLYRRVSFDEIFKLYNRQVLSYCVRHVASLEDAEEIAQDVFVNLWKHFDEIDDYSRLQAYLIISARNHIINFYRRRVDSEVYADYVRYVNELRQTGSTSQPVEYKEFEEMTMRAISQLSPTKRMVIMMSRFDGLDNREISLRLNISLQSVKNALAQGLKELRSIMRPLPLIYILLIVKHCFPFIND